MGYVKISRKGTWGYHYYTMKGHSNELVFKEGQEVKVMWPDSSRTKETIRIRKYVEDVEDWGAHYKVESQIPYIVASVNGLEKKIEDDFDKLLFHIEDLSEKEEEK